MEAIEKRKLSEAEYAKQWKALIKQAKDKGFINGNGELVIQTNKVFKQKKEIK